MTSPPFWLALPMLFEHGQVYWTDRAHEELMNEEVSVALGRHVRGNWGLVGDEVAEQNDRCIRSGHQILSCWKSPSGQRYWLRTNAERTETTVFLAEEY